MNIDNVDGLLISGNNVALTSGTMAQVSASCQVSVFGNSYPGGSTESSITSTPANCPPPSITSFTPTTGTSGTTVTVSGDNFIGATKVTVGGVAVPFAVGSNKQVNITAPSSGGTIDVITPYGTAVSATDFGTTSTTPGAPAVTSFSPTSGPVGTSVTITGSAFTGATSVAFGGVAATFAVVSDTQITASVPTGAGSGPISVATPYGATRSTSSFSVTTAPAPAISSFSPSSGPAGTRVTISGSGFTGATAVAFNGRAATFTVQSATSISGVVPAGARSGPITVTTPGGTAVSAKRYRVK